MFRPLYSRSNFGITMKQLAVIAALIMFAACSPKKEWYTHKIAAAEESLLRSAQSGKVDTAAVNSLLAAYEKYADSHIGDTTGADYLFKAADFYRYLHKPLRSVRMYDKIYNHYPTYSKRAYALFLQGFIYENEVGNTTAARLKYQQFLDAYPNHPIANDVRTTLQLLGKTPEQLIKEFEARQHGADSLQQAAGK